MHAIFEWKNVSDLIGQTLIKIDGMKKEDAEIRFHTSDRVYLMFHDQDCCEHVEITEVIGDPADLLDTPILMADELTNEAENFPAPEYEDSYTWTFYRFQTIKGSVVLRWLGRSNGYYSERVSFALVADNSRVIPFTPRNQ